MDEGYRKARRRLRETLEAIFPGTALEFRGGLLYDVKRRRPVTDIAIPRPGKRVCGWREPVSSQRQRPRVKDSKFWLSRKRGSWTIQ